MMTRSKTRYRSSSKSRNEVETFVRIPFDVIIEILLRLPAKSIARFRCLSKLFASTIRNPDFTESFFTISSSRPKLLFTCRKNGESFFFSSPHPQNLSPITANNHMSSSASNMCRPVRGLVCGLNQRTSKGHTVTVPLICNPSTGQSLALPRVKTRRKIVINYLGYDPINKQFKVLCCMASLRLSGSEDYQVLTLTTGKKLSWRMIKCDIPHCPYTNGIFQYDGICISGVLYYVAIVYDVYDGSPDIISFDVRSEKFSYIRTADQDFVLDVGGKLESTMVNYKGKLAMLHPNDVNPRVCTGIQLWVLEDADKHEWSSFIFILPPPWKNVIEKTKLCFVGITGTGEIVLTPNTISDSFFLIYYNPERNTIKRVEIQGMEAFKRQKAYTFLDHVEDVNLVPCV